jgi:hypothetical protein
VWLPVSFAAQAFFLNKRPAQVRRFSYCAGYNVQCTSRHVYGAADSHLTGCVCAGRLADMASQMGVSQATGPLGDLSKGVQGMASMLGGQVRLSLSI